MNIYVFLFFSFSTNWNIITEIITKRKRKSNLDWRFILFYFKLRVFHERTKIRWNLTIVQNENCPKIFARQCTHTRVKIRTYFRTISFQQSPKRRIGIYRFVFTAFLRKLSQLSSPKLEPGPRFLFRNHATRHAISPRRERAVPGLAVYASGKGRNRGSVTLAQGIPEVFTRVGKGRCSLRVAREVISLSRRTTTRVLVCSLL